jgi:formylglycine-generating enzyme required for sulfatase activity
MRSAVNCTVIRIALILLVYAALSCSDDNQNFFQVDIVHPLDGGRDITLASMPGGTYAMGSDFLPALLIDTFFIDPLSGEVFTDTALNAERPIHFSVLSPFAISTTEITQEQYKAVTGVNPAHFYGEANMPVENVTWYDAADFCNGLSEQLGLSSCYDSAYGCDFGADGFRLPTESEWEYAARAGAGTEYFNGDDPSGMMLIGWYVANSEMKTHSVAAKMANNAGLFDMHGNVMEWCQDYFNFYSCGSQVDNRGPANGVYRVVRGGSWAGQPTDCRLAIRFAIQPGLATNTIGFRIVRRQ